VRAVVDHDALEVGLGLSDDAPERRGQVAAASNAGGGSRRAAIATASMAQVAGPSSSRRGDPRRARRMAPCRSARARPRARGLSKGRETATIAPDGARGSPIRRRADRQPADVERAAEEFRLLLGIERCGSTPERALPAGSRRDSRSRPARPGCARSTSSARAISTTGRLPWARRAHHPGDRLELGRGRGIAVRRPRAGAVDDHVAGGRGLRQSATIAGRRRRGPCDRPRGDPLDRPRARDRLVARIASASASRSIASSPSAASACCSFAAPA
jgi:hypothetical protein